eukprot:TRINITY_DN7498_c0_g1_i4.p2 TRINITY_DN7498_c0_g1~~TRINITY_DN7498_c0_g1_i4.p2  ORF type:complete len:255 (+),score=75.02 TRINITY_DN7498_c0_g1_i4:489-1253(+)
MSWASRRRPLTPTRLDNKLTFKPSGLHSKAHRSLALAVRTRTQKASRIMSYSETMDPEAVKTQRVRTEEGTRKREKRRSSGAAGYPRYRDGARGKRARMSATYLEEGVDYDETGLKSLKEDTRNRYDYSDSSSDGDEDGDGAEAHADAADEDARPRRAAAAKADRSLSSKAGASAERSQSDSEQSEEEEAEGQSFAQDEDSGEDVAPAVRARGGKRRVLDDEDSDTGGAPMSKAGGGEAAPAKRRGAVLDSDSE